MTLKNFLALTALSLAFGTVSAQTEEAALPRKVSNVEVLDMSIPTTISRTRISPLNWKRTTVPKATISTASA